jgi:hypothetical protein
MYLNKDFENYYYHVTPQDNDASIEARGILPEKSRGKRKRSWFVCAERLPWAIKHVARRHGVAEDEIVVYLIPLTSARGLKRHGRLLYYSDIVNHPLYKIYTWDDGVRRRKCYTRHFPRARKPA